MDIRKLQRVIVDALEDVKAQDIAVYNTTTLSDLFDRVILASGTSNRHTRSLASSVAEKVKHAGGMVVSVEGEDTGEWVLVDLGDAVVHIMQPAVRAYYTLEELWGGRPVNVKLTDKGARPRAARAPAPHEVDKPARAAKSAGPARASQPAKTAKSPRAVAAKAGSAARGTHAAKTAGAGTTARKTGGAVVRTGTGKAAAARRTGRTR